MANSVSQLFRFGSGEYDLSSRCHIMGILNVTPDSFSDGGKYFDLERAVERGVEIADEGADFIDVGGESTRPGSEGVTTDEEVRRVIPVIERLAKRVRLPISVDTMKPEVAQRALEAGAVMVNDISGLHANPELADVIAKHDGSVIIMHMKGTPKTMQGNPGYGNLIEEICIYLQEGIQLARQKMIRQIIVDPGIGFGKTLHDNLEIMKKIGEFRRFGYPVLIGPSRKSFIGKILDVQAGDRFEGTAAAVAVAVMNGANIVRVHDVRQMKRVAQIVDAIKSS